MKTHHLALILALVANATANILIKEGMRGRSLSLAQLDRTLLAIVTSPQVLAGVVLFAVNVLAYAFVLSRVHLSVAYPIMTTTGFLIVITYSVWQLHERLDPIQIVGLCLVIAGVVMVASRLE